MAAAAATDFFLALCARVGDDAGADVDALAVGETLGIHAPTVFAHVHELKVRGWIEATRAHTWHGLQVRVTAAGASVIGSERLRRAGVARRTPS